MLCVQVGMWMFAGAVVATAETPRYEVSLNGQWTYCLVDDLSAPAPKDGWKTCAVPGYLNGIDYQRAWMRRSFVVPGEMRGKRIKLHFGGVKYNSSVFVNDKKVGGCFGGYQPFEVDVTDVVHFDRVNQLLVGCHDWTGVFTGEKVEFNRNPGWHRVRSAPKDRILSPMGGLYGLYGIWDDVTLRAHPAVFAKDLFIKPSVRRGELAVDYTLANESATDANVELATIVEDNGADLLHFDTVRVHVPAGSTVTTTVRRAWSDPHLWSHVDPFLYHLRTELSSGDVLRTRFGFREFWTEGHRFYLNGVPVNLLATSWWPPHSPMTREEIRERWEAVKRCGCVAFRTHTQPWRSVHYDVADEVGLLMIVEGAVWNDESVYRINDPVFWDNYASHLKAMIDRDKNRPSVVMWSLENEFYGGRLNDEAPAKQDLVRMGRLVKKWDPTRPFFYESDGDPGGVADCIGIHYPHEYPQFTCWPNEADWLSKPADIPHMFHNGQDKFVWRKDKPIYVGEFLWIPSHDPSWQTVFFGDEAYRDYRRYRNLAKAECWTMQILGYRHHEVAGISPWTVIEGGPLDESNPLYQAHQYAYQPIAAYCRDYDTRFFSGETINRRVEVFNDTMESSDLELSSELIEGVQYIPGVGVHGVGVITELPTRSLTLGPAEHRMLDIALKMPECASRESFHWWHLMLRRNGESTSTDDFYNCDVSPRRPLPKLSARFGLYDPKGATRRLFQAGGLAAASITRLDRLPDDIDVLVIGAGTLTADEPVKAVIGRTLPARTSLESFVSRGGRILVLEQEAYPHGLFNVRLTEHCSTMTFPLRPSHPALSGLRLGHSNPHWAELDSDIRMSRLDPSDLKFWRGDHMVASNEPARPASSSMVAIVGSGSGSGIDHAPLLERPVGRGCVIHSQLKLVEKYAQEPVAGQILSNLLEYLADYQPTSRKTAVLGGSAEYLAYLRSVGLEFDHLPKDAREVNLSDYSLLLCRDALVTAPRLRAYLERGGNVVLHRSTSETLAQVNSALGLDLALQNYSGHVARAEGMPRTIETVLGLESETPRSRSRSFSRLSGGRTDRRPRNTSQHANGLLEAITREDLYWLGQHVGIGWATTPRATDMADGVLSKTLDGKDAKTYQIEEWDLDGGIVERREPGVTFATVGSASSRIIVPATGMYVIGLVARGTPCQMVYPIVRVSIDEREFGTASVARRDWHTVTVFGPIEKGVHRVSVAFTNDASDPPREDRNLYVDKVLVARDSRADEVTYLTTPPAVAAVACGKGTLVIDQLRWDTEQRNARKAARYACSLLTALGGSFTSRLGVPIECEQMTPRPGMRHFHNRGTYVSVACNGYVKTPIQVAVSGRYAVEVVASGTPAAGVYPLVAVRIDGQEIGRVPLTSGNWRPYPLNVELDRGAHELELAFLNDRNQEGEDRNLMLDKIVFFRQTP